MKKLLYPLFLAGICMILASGCDSENGNEPDQPVSPVDPVNPIDSVNPIDTVKKDSVDVDSFGIGPFIPYTGQIEPLSKEIRPTLTEGKKWLRVRIVSPYASPGYALNKFGKYWFINSLIQGDSTVIDLNAKVMHWRYDKEKVLPDYTDPYVGHDLYWEDSEIVYKILPRANQNFVYEIDFKVDASEYENIKGLHVVSKGTMVLRGKERRALKIRYGNLSHYDYWVEGIGSLVGYTVDHRYAITTEFYGYPLLLQCYDGDELIYDYREFKPELYKEIEVFTDYDQQ